MKKNVIYVLALLVLILYLPNRLVSQCRPTIVIDGNSTVVTAGLTLPYWLTAGQTISIGEGVTSISILRFTLNGGNLTMSNVISVTSSQTVPSGEVWKIEAIAQNAKAAMTITAVGMTSPRSYSTAGTYTFVVPAGVSSICVEAWGGGRWRWII